MRFKKIPIDYLIICLDRLTRFKPTNEKYKRVFFDILNKFAIKDNARKPDFNNIEAVVEIVENIINDSVPKSIENDFYINNLIKDFENKAFYQDCESSVFLNNKINYKNLFFEIKKQFLSQNSSLENLSDNLKWLIIKNDERELDLKKLRQKFQSKFPVEKVILCEGATEEILLPELAKICGYDFCENGIFLLGAGGKNQVGRKYLQMLDETKLPIFILLDSDAVEIEQVVSKKLREVDDIYLIQNGEFEDILPKELIIEAVNFNFSNEHKCLECDFDDEIKMAKNLELAFKIKGFGDFKKSDFANSVKNYLGSVNKLIEDFNLDSVRSIVDRIKSVNLSKLS